MRKWSIIILVLICVLLFWCSPVLASTSADVTITATGIVVATPSGLIITYINNSLLRIDWAKGLGAENTMVRAKYGSMPTSRTDGYLVYYGTGVTANDTSVDVENTVNEIHYRAWSQTLAGLWENIGISNFFEEGGMTLIALLLFAGFLSFLGIRNRSAPLGIIASVAWFGILAYTRINPIGHITLGTFADEALMMAFVGVAIFVPFLCWQRGRMARESGNGEMPREEPNHVSNTSIAQESATRHGTSERFAESSEEYKERVHAILHPPKRRR